MLSPSGYFGFGLLRIVEKHKAECLTRISHRSVASIKARRARGISGAPFVGPFVQDKGMDLGDFKSCHVAEPV